MSNPEGKVPPEARKFSFPEEDGLADVAETAEIPQQKYVVGQVVKKWGLPDEYNEPYQEAVRAGFITKKCELTKTGVEHLLNEKKESNQPELKKITPETVLPKYVVGQIVKNWGSPDEFNEPYIEALHNGLITADCVLTEKGVTYLLRKDLGLPDEPELESNTKVTEPIVEIAPLLEPEKKLPEKFKIPVSSAYRQKKAESAMGDLAEKNLLDSVQTVLEKRGFNILGVNLERGKETVNGEEIYTLHIEFGQNGGNSGDRKAKKTLRLVGSEGTLVDTLERGSFNFPTTKSPKKLRRAFK